MKVLRSDCCEQPVTIRHDYDHEGWCCVAMWHECIKCKEPCGVIEVEVDEWGKGHDKDKA